MTTRFHFFQAKKPDFTLSKKEALTDLSQQLGWELNRLERSIGDLFQETNNLSTSKPSF